MNLSQLNYFITLANEKNYTRASTKLYVTQPTLTQQIKQMENELGHQLFIRSHKEITLTSEGKIFYEYATKALKDWDDCLTALNTSNNKEIIGSLSIGLFWTFGYNHIENFLTRFKDSYPKVNLELNVDGSAILLDKVLSNQLDCAFITATFHSNDNEYSYLSHSLNFILLDQSPLMCLANENSKLAKKNILTFSDFDDEPIIYISKQSNMHSAFSKCLNDSHCKPRIIGYSSQAEINIQVARANIGYSFLTERTFNSIEHNGIKAIPLVPQLMRQIYLISNKENKNPTIELFNKSILKK